MPGNVLLVWPPSLHHRRVVALWGEETGAEKSLASSVWVCMEEVSMGCWVHGCTPVGSPGLWVLPTALALLSFLVESIPAQHLPGPSRAEVAPCNPSQQLGSLMGHEGYGHMSRKGPAGMSCSSYGTGTGEPWCDTTLWGSFPSFLLSWTLATIRSQPCFYFDSYLTNRGLHSI